MGRPEVLEEAVDRLVLEPGIAKPDGFLRSLPLLTVQHDAAVTYHAKLWRHEYRLDRGLFDHDFFVFTDPVETFRDRNLLAIWQRSKLPSSGQLREFVIEFGAGLPGQLFIACDRFDDLRLSETSLRQLTELHVPVEYAVRRKRFLVNLGRIAPVEVWDWTQNVIFPVIGSLEKAVTGDRSTDPVSGFTEPDAILPNLVIRRLIAHSDSHYAAQLLQRSEVERFLAPWLEDHPERRRLVDAIDRFRQDLFDPASEGHLDRIDAVLALLAQRSESWAGEAAEVVRRCVVHSRSGT